MKKILDIFTFFCIVYTNLAQAGTNVGNGSGFLLTEVNPWYIGAEPVSYCIESPQPRNSTFTKDELSSVVLRAINNWIDTLKLLQPRKISPIQRQSGTRYFMTGINTKLSVDFVEKPCANTTELKFLIGVEDADVEHYRKSSEEKPHGVALRKSYDVDKGRARGVIWIDKNYFVKRSELNREVSQAFAEASLYNILLHELGHVFGFGHQMQGVMESVVSETIPNGLIEFSTEWFANSLWFQSERKVCGNLQWSRTDSTFYRQLGGKSNTWGCVQREVKKVVITTSGEAGIQKQSLTVEAAWKQKPQAAVSGCYKTSDNPLTDLGVLTCADRHTFISLNPPSVAASSVINNETSILNIHTDVSNYEIVLNVYSVQSRLFEQLKIVVPKGKHLYLD